MVMWQSQHHKGETGAVHYLGCEKIDEQNILITMVGGHNHMGVFASSAW